jgi:predicted permease
MRNALMVVQVAGSLTLLLVAGFLVIGYSTINNIEIGFNPSTMLLLSLDPVRDGYSADKAAALLDTLPEKLQSVPGVRQAVLTEAPPFSPQAAVATLIAAPQDGLPEQVVSSVAKSTVGSNYFAALSVSMLEGREFDLRDQRVEVTSATVLPVVINQTAAHAFFGNRDPLGRRLSDSGNAFTSTADPMDMMGRASGLGRAKSYTVVGVVKDLSAPMSVSDVSQTASTLPVVYLPLTRSDFAHPSVNGILIMLRADRGLDAMDGVRRELAGIDPNLAIFNVKTLAEQVQDTSAMLRMSSFIYTGIGAFGLILAAIGLAGVTAYSVARRRKELGIRIALGARKSQVLGLVMREGGVLVLIGSILGLAGGFAFSRVLSAFSSMLGPSFTAGAHDPRLLIGAPVLLAALAMLACYVPARRSTKIDPLVALREE